jgi:hypothetical protein
MAVAGSGVGAGPDTASMLIEQTRFGSETVTLLVATERAAESLVRAMETEAVGSRQMVLL